MDSQEIFSTCVKIRHAREVLASSFSEIRKTFREKQRKLIDTEHRLFNLFDESGQLEIFEEMETFAFSPEIMQLIDDPLGDEVRSTE